MTWLDWSAIATLILFGAVGARLGSLWLGACVIGGFLGASLADTYSPAVAEYLGRWSWHYGVAWFIVFIVGLGLILGLGYLLSRGGSFIFAGVVDGIAGLVVGVVAGLAVVVLSVSFLSPFFPRVQHTAVWKNSRVVKPMSQWVESFFEKGFLKKIHMNADWREKIEESIDELKSLSPIKK